MTQTQIGKAYEIELKKSINTDTPSKDIKPIGGEPVPHILNNGIERDGGIVNLYETDEDESASYDFVFHASNGKRVQIKNQGSSGNGIWVDDTQIMDHGDKSVWLMNRVDLSLPGYKILDISPGLDEVWVLAAKPNGDVYLVEMTLDNTFTSETLVLSGFYTNGKNMGLSKIMRAAADATSRAPNLVAYIEIQGGSPRLHVKRISDLAVSYYGGTVTNDIYQLNIFESNTSPNNYIVHGVTDVATSGDFCFGDTFTAGNVVAAFSRGDMNCSMAISDDEVLLTGSNVGNTIAYSIVNTNTLTESTAALGAAVTGGYSIPGAVALTAAAAPNAFWGGVGTAYGQQVTGRNYYPLVDTVLDTSKVYDFVNYALGEKFSHFSIHQAGLVSEIGEAGLNFGPQQSRERTTWNTPQVYTLKRFDGSFVLFYGKDNYARVNEVAPGIVKVGPIFVDTIKEKADAIDEGYNGNAAGYGVTSSRMNIKGETDYFGTVDSGESIVFSDETIQFLWTAYFVSDELVNYLPFDIYRDGEYAGQITPIKLPASNNETYTVNSAKLDTVYVENARLPIAGPTPVDLFSVDLPQGTALRSENYNGYDLQNILAGEYTLFMLFGQVYAFDGNYIWLVPTSAGLVAGTLQRVAPAQGLRYLTSAPEAAYFISNFDNGLFVFNGGRSLVKQARMNQKATVENAIYNVEENALHMITEDSLLIMRDNIATENARPFTGDVQLYSTVNGIVYGQDAEWKSLQYRGDVFTAGATAVVPLDFQTAFTGPMDNQWFKSLQYIIYLQRPAGPGALTLDFTFHWIDADGSGTEIKELELAAPDFDSEGYTRIRYMPTKDAIVGGSLEIECAERIVILDIVQYYTDMGNALVPDNRTAQPGT